MGVVAASSVSIRDSTLAACCLTTAGYIILNSNSNWRGRQWTNRLVASAKLGIHLRQSWSVQKVNWVSSKYIRDISTSHTIARHPRWVLSYTCPGFVWDRNQYPIGLMVLSGWSYNTTHPTWTLQVSESSVKWPYAYSNASTGGEINWSLSFFIADASSAVSVLTSSGWSLCSFRFSGVALPAKLGSKRQNTLQRLRMDRNSAMFTGGLNPLTALVVQQAIFNLHCLITWPR